MAVITTLVVKHKFPIQQGLPVPESINLRRLEKVALRNPSGARVPCAPSVLARWGGPVSDVTKPVKWLLLDVQSNELGEHQLHTDSQNFFGDQQFPDSLPEVRLTAILEGRPVTGQFGELQTTTDNPLRRVREQTGGFASEVPDFDLAQMDLELCLRFHQFASESFTRVQVKLTNRKPYGYDGSTPGAVNFTSLSLLVPEGTEVAVVDEREQGVMVNLLGNTIDLLPPTGDLHVFPGGSRKVWDIFLGPNAREAAEASVSPGLILDPAYVQMTAVLPVRFSLRMPRAEA